MANCLRCGKNQATVCTSCVNDVQDEATADLLAACEVALDALGCDRVRQDRLEAQHIISAAIAKAAPPHPATDPVAQEA